MDYCNFIIGLIMVGIAGPAGLAFYFTRSRAEARFLKNENGRSFLEITVTSGLYSTSISKIRVPGKLIGFAAPAGFYPWEFGSKGALVSEILPKDLRIKAGESTLSFKLAVEPALQKGESVSVFLKQKCWLRTLKCEAGYR